MDELARDLERMAAAMEVYRMRTHARRLIRGMVEMIEIKGLGANVEAARAAIRRARVATARMNESGGTLERTANEIASVFEQHTSDLLREATELGNGSPEPVTQSGQAAGQEVPAVKPQFPPIDPGAAA